MWEQCIFWFLEKELTLHSRDLAEMRARASRETTVVDAVQMRCRQSLAPGFMFLLEKEKKEESVQLMNG